MRGVRADFVKKKFVPSNKLQKISDFEGGHGCESGNHINLWFPENQGGKVNLDNFQRTCIEMSICPYITNSTPTQFQHHHHHPPPLLGHFQWT